jgi:hypothetical protein
LRKPATLFATPHLVFCVLSSYGNKQNEEDFTIMVSRNCSPNRLLLTSLVLFSLWLWDTPALLANYVPPRQPSAPRRTVPRISRGGSCNPDEPGQLMLLAPLSHVGQTIAKRPTVAWYVPDRTSYGLEVRLFRANGERLYRFVLQSQPGIMQFSLPSDQPELSVGQYRWQVVLLCNPSTPSLNVVSAADVAVVDPPQTLQTQLSASRTPQQRLETYASQGLWYDALTVALDPRNPQLQIDTAALLGALADVEAPTVKDWSDRLRQIATLTQSNRTLHR